MEATYDVGCFCGSSTVDSSRPIENAGVNIFYFELKKSRSCVDRNTIYREGVGGEVQASASRLSVSAQKLHLIQILKIS